MTPEQRRIKAFELTETHRERVDRLLTHRFGTTEQQLIKMRLPHCLKESERKRRIGSPA
jgi:hypothetical protein